MAKWQEKVEGGRKGWEREDKRWGGGKKEGGREEEGGEGEERKREGRGWKVREVRGKLGGGGEVIVLVS